MAKSKKSLLKSKTVWGSLLSGLALVMYALGPELGVDLSVVAQVVGGFGVTLGGVGVRDAINKL